MIFTTDSYLTEFLIIFIVIATIIYLKKTNKKTSNIDSSDPFFKNLDNFNNYKKRDYGLPIIIFFLGFFFILILYYLNTLKIFQLLDASTLFFTFIAMLIIIILIATFLYPNYHLCFIVNDLSKIKKINLQEYYIYKESLFISGFSYIFIYFIILYFIFTPINQISFSIFVYYFLFISQYFLPFIQFCKDIVKISKGEINLFELIFLLFFLFPFGVSYLQYKLNILAEKNQI